MKITNRAELTRWVRSCQQGSPWDARWAYPLRDVDASPMALGKLDAVADDAIDLAAMSVHCVVNTPALDRYGTVIVPAGCDFQEYKSVPVVLCNHSSWSLPIGKAEDPNRNCTVEVSPEAVTARTFFTQSVELAVQVFHLIAERIFRGVSVGFDPDFDAIEWILDDEETPPRIVGAIFHRWKMLEYSHVTIPANPECTTRALHRGRVDGRPMLPEIKRALEPFALTRQLWTGGYDPETRSMSQPTNPPPAAPSPAPVTPPASPPAVPPTPPATRCGKPAGTRADEETTPPPAPAADTPDDDVDQSLLPGAQALVNLHALLMQIVDFAADTVPTLEKSEVIDWLNAAAASASDLAGQTADAIGQLYPDVEVEDPDADPAPDDDTRAEEDDDDEDDDEDKDRKKRSLPKPRLKTRKLSKSANATVIETCDFMDEHSAEENLSRQQRAAVRQYASTLRAVANADDEEDDGLDEESARLLRPVLERLVKEQVKTRRMIAAASGRRPR